MLTGEKSDIAERLSAAIESRVRACRDPVAETELLLDVLNELYVRHNRVAELEAALREIAAGHVDDGGNRRNHEQATAIARKALGMDRR